jgi:lysophospholipase L1-like esterase
VADYNIAPITGSPYTPLSRITPSGTMRVAVAESEAPAGYVLGDELVWLRPTAVQTTGPVNALAGQLVRTSTSGGGFTANLPPAPPDGTMVGYADSAAAGSWSSTNPLTVGRNGATINGTAANDSLTSGGGLALYLYDAGSTNWNRRLIQRTPSIGGGATTGTADGTTDNAATFAALSPGGYTAPVGPLRFAASLTIPAGVVVTLPPGAYLKLDSGVVPDLKGRLVHDAMAGGAPLPGQAGCIGDSRALYGGSASVDGANTLAGHGIWSWVAAYTGGVFVPDLRYYMAVASTTTADLDGQVTNLLAAGAPAACFVLTGTNDDATVSSATQVSRIVGAWSRLLTNGIQPIHLSDLPRTLTGTNTTTTQLKARNAATNARLKRLAGRLGVMFYDSHRWLTNGNSSASGDPQANVMFDGLHPSPYGAWIVGQGMGLDLAKHFPEFYGWDRSFDPGDIYDATLTGTTLGQLCPNPTMVGTGGVLGSVTGTAPTGWNVAKDSGAGSGAASVPARASPFAFQNALQLAATPATAGGGLTMFSLYAPCSPATPPAGARLQAAIDVSVSGSAYGSNDQLIVGCRYGAGLTLTASFTMVISGLGPWPGDFSGRIFVPSHLVPAGATILYLWVNYNVDAGGGVRTLQLGAPSVRVIS